MATWWIRQAIGLAVSNQGHTIRVPTHAGELTRKIYGISYALAKTLGRKPTAAEIAVENPTLTVKQIQFYLEKGRPLLSLEQPIGASGDGELGEVLPGDQEQSPVSESTNHILEEQMKNALEELPLRYALVLRLRFGLDDGHSLTLEVTGKKMGITRERVRQLQELAIKQLRGNETTLRKLRDFLHDDWND